MTNQLQIAQEKLQDFQTETKEELQMTLKFHQFMKHELSLKTNDERELQIDEMVEMELKELINN